MGSPLTAQQTAYKSPGSGWGRPRPAHRAAAEAAQGTRRREEVGSEELLLQGQVFIMSVAGPDPRRQFPARCW